MDTIKAFARAEVARAEGKKERKYDYNKAIKRIKETKPTEAYLGMLEDWGWTYKKVYENGKFLVDLKKKPLIHNISGSVWATPTLELDGNKEDCFVGGKK